MMISIKVPKWNVKELCGYEPMTTFWEDFCIAERFGCDAIRDTYKRAFSEWKSNYKYLTELVMVLNHKISSYYPDNMEYAKLYNRLYLETDRYACDNLQGDELAYFYQITD